MSPEPSPPPGPHVVCLLAEGSYFRGAAAMANSLVRNGFTGHIVVGYRGALPRWGGPVSPRPGPAQSLAPGVDIQFLAVEGDWHLSNLKPHVLRRVAALHPGLGSLWYFDVDIVLKTQWEAFARWSAAGLVLVLGHGRDVHAAEPRVPPGMAGRSPNAPASATGRCPAT